MFLFTVFNLTNGIDVEQTRLDIESYRKENQDIIRRNKLKKVTDCLLWFISEFYIHLSSICKWIICSLDESISYRNFEKVSHSHIHFLYKQHKMAFVVAEPRWRANRTTSWGRARSPPIHSAADGRGRGTRTKGEGEAEERAHQRPRQIFCRYFRINVSSIWVTILNFFYQSRDKWLPWYRLKLITLGLMGTKHFRHFFIPHRGSVDKASATDAGRVAYHR